MNQSEPVGVLLRRLREEAGLSVRGLAEQAGVDAANVSRLETGIAPRSTMSSLTKLAEALGIDPNRLYRAAGITDAPAALPSMRPYLRTKYGHLPKAKLDELAKFLETIEAEQVAKKRPKRP